jgi:transposase
MAKRGRPTKYDPAMCALVIECGAEGMGKCEMAEELGIHYETFEAYQDAHPEFSEAVKAALRKSQAWWEKQGRLATFGAVDGYNATSYIFQMKNRFKQDWAERQLHGSDPDNPLPTGFDMTFRKASNGTQGG